MNQEPQPKDIELVFSGSVCGKKYSLRKVFPNLEVQMLKDPEMILRDMSYIVAEVSFHIRQELTQQIEEVRKNSNIT